MKSPEGTLPLTLTGFEVVHLCDAINNGDIALGLPDRDAYVPLAREALLLLGSVYRELVTEREVRAGPVSIEVTEEIVWLLRSKVKTGDLAIDMKTAIGPKLLLKLYSLLLEFNSGVADWPAPAQDPTAEEEQERRNILDVLTKGEPDVTDDELGSGPDPGADADYFPGD